MSDNPDATSAAPALAAHESKGGQHDAAPLARKAPELTDNLPAPTVALVDAGAGVGPASPLPWTVDGRARGDVVIEDASDEDGLVANVGAVFSAVEDGPALAFDADLRDAEYIVHACNGFPTVIAALVELAIAVDFHTITAEPSERLSLALDATWGLVDPDGKVRAAERQRAGCTNCGADIELGDDLCDGCAYAVREVRP